MWWPLFHVQKGEARDREGSSSCPAIEEEEEWWGLSFFSFHLLRHTALSLSLWKKIKFPFKRNGEKQKERKNKQSVRQSGAIRCPLPPMERHGKPPATRKITGSPLIAGFDEIFTHERISKREEEEEKKDAAAAFFFFCLLLWSAPTSRLKKESYE